MEADALSVIMCYVAVLVDWNESRSRAAPGVAIMGPGQHHGLGRNYLIVCPDIGRLSSPECGNQLTGLTSDTELLSLASPTE